MIYNKTHLSHRIVKEAPNDPISVFRSDGALVGHFPSMTAAEEAAKTSRIKELILELHSLIVRQ